MMKNKIVSLLLILQIFLLQAQQDSLFDAVNINIDGKKLLMMGEHHHIQEILDVQYSVIEHIILQNQEIKNFQLFTENSPAWNYYLDKLLHEDDSLGFKKFLIHCSSYTKYDTLNSRSQAYYDFYMKFYYLSKSLKNRTFQFKYFDYAHYLHPLLYTLLDIFSKYSFTDAEFITQRNLLDSMLQDNSLRYDFSTFHQHFGNYFTENRELFQETLSEVDFYWVSEMMKCLFSLSGTPLTFEKSFTQERENIMFEQINNSYNDSTFFFCKIGAAHIRKPYSASDAYLSWKKENDRKVVSAGEMLETYSTSHFKNKIVLCTLQPLFVNGKFLQKEGSYVMRRFPIPYWIPFIEHKEYLNSLLTGNVTLIDMRKTKIRRAHKITDYMIVIKEANSVM